MTYEEIIKALTDELEDEVDDMVHHPSHYTGGDIECIEAIRASMTPSAYLGYLKGNIIKYLWRFEQKNGIFDLQKAQVYLNWLLEQYDVIASIPHEKGKSDTDK